MDTKKEPISILTRLFKNIQKETASKPKEWDSEMFAKQNK
jgi:hypothetical protein